MDATEKKLGNRAGCMLRSIAIRLSQMRPDCMKDWSFFELLKLFHKYKITHEQCVKLFGLRNAEGAMALFITLDDEVADGSEVAVGVKRAKDVFMVNGWSGEECREAVGRILAFLEVV